MADTATVRHDNSRRDMVPDMIGVKSRVSWSAILAGTVIAIACYTVLTFLFAAVGVTLSDVGVRGDAIGIGAVVAAIATIVVSLFLGGWISAQLTAGENRQEAVIYGILTWAAVTAASLWMVSLGVRAGYFAAVGGSVIVQNNERIPQWEDAALQAGVPQQRINEAKAAIDPNRARAEVNSPENQEKARQAAMFAAWMALVGTMLSMASSICGALVGRGVAFHLYPVRVATDPRPQLIIP